jgi:hypothetical protein
MTEQAEMTHSEQPSGKTELPAVLLFRAGSVKLKVNHHEVSD